MTGRSLARLVLTWGFVVCWLSGGSLGWNQFVLSAVPSAHAEELAAEGRSTDSTSWPDVDSGLDEEGSTVTVQTSPGQLEGAGTAPPLVAEGEESGQFPEIDGTAIRDDRPLELAQLAPEAIPMMTPLISLGRGEVRSMAIDGLTRVAIGDPEVIDFTVISGNQLLLRAMALGTTNLILWDRTGEHTFRVTVASALPESVKLTVQVVEMDREAKNKLGVDWMDSVTFSETTFASLGPTNVSQIARLGEAFRLGALSRTGASAVLNMLVSEGKARILAEPKLVTSSGKEASAFIGVEVPVLTATSISAGTVTQQIEFKETGVKLKFQPTVLDDKPSIQLVIDAKVSSIDTTKAITVAGILVPGFRVRQTQTEIVTKSGEAVFIAGLIQDEEKQNLGRLPGLGKVPILGPLFRSKEFASGQTELVIIVTPQLRAKAEMIADRAAAVDHALAAAEVSAALREQ